MTVDGANDAPALSHANVGIAVEDATNAALDAIVIVLTEPICPPSSTIVHAIRGSRQIFQRMRNYTIYACTVTIRIPVCFAVLAFSERDANGRKYHKDRQLHMIVHSQVAIITQALIFVARSHGFPFMESPSTALLVPPSRLDQVCHEGNHHPLVPPSVACLPHRKSFIKRSTIQQFHIVRHELNHLNTIDGLICHAKLRYNRRLCAIKWWDRIATQMARKRIKLQQERFPASAAQLEVRLALRLLDVLERTAVKREKNTNLFLLRVNNIYAIFIALEIVVLSPASTILAARGLEKVPPP
ncbi:unnamed protein product [Rhizoctonia solani]|uniref:Uncharacterized protein n=1 Tax=Rhizoctonia solani TaxID=456999 RepID=A0A8H3AA54_9AGAM|nr:unnamed protein product [Rhizoctonia solani]